MRVALLVWWRGAGNRKEYGWSGGLLKLRHFWSMNDWQSLLAKEEDVRGLLLFKYLVASLDLQLFEVAHF